MEINLKKKTKMTLMKTISVLVILVMVLQFSSPAVFGVENIVSNQNEPETITQEIPAQEENKQETEKTEETNNSSSTEPKIIGEIEENRTLNQKEFLLEDGSILSATYPVNVHYEEDNELVDINNTFQEVQNTTNNAFEEADNQDVYENTKNYFKIKFSKKSNNNLVHMHVNDHNIKWSLKNSNKVEAIKEKEGLEANPEDITQLNNIISETVTYENILENIDIQYTVIADTVKEDIILKNEQAIQQEITFEYQLSNAILKETENGDIVIAEENSETPLFIIDKPFMYDAQNETSDAIEVILEQQNKNKYTITLKPSKEWLEAEEREYPVTIDPVVTSSLNRSDIQDTYIFGGDETSTTKHNSHILRIGSNNRTGTHKNPTRALMKFNIPELQPGDQVIKAVLNLCSYPETNEWTPSASPIQIDAHKITANWDQTTANWNNMNGNYDAKVEDYITYQYSNSEPCKFYDIDITAIAKDWYTTGNNYGIMLKDHTEVYNAQQSDAYFFSADVHNAFTNARPIVQIVYRNQTGLESYQTYHSQSIGRAGEVYTNDYNGNLVLMHQDADTPGSKLPVSVYHVYNTNNRNEDWSYGKGFRLNLSQVISNEIIDGREYAKYIDEDGTKHYFLKEGNNYTDEDNLGLELTFENDSYILKDKGNNKLTFVKTQLGPVANYLWYLKELEDADGNKIILDLTLTTTHGAIISKVTDAAGDSITFTYAGGRLSKITDSTGKSTNYTYNGNGNLIQIQYADGNISQYTYNDKYLLTQAKDIDNYYVDYEYYNENVNRVKSIKEYSSQNEQGNSFTIEYGNNVTKFTDNQGYSNNYTFNNWGQTISISDFGKEEDNVDNAYGKMYQYGEGTNNKNKLTLESQLVSNSQAENNLLTNANFSNGFNNWERTGYANIINTTAEISANGNQYIKMNCSSLGEQGIYQVVNVSGQKGDIFTASAWFDTDSVPIRDNRKVGILIKVIRNDNTEQIVTIPANAEGDHWQYVAGQFITDADYKAIHFYLQSNYNVNYTCFDCAGLFKDTYGLSYVYDSEGNVISAKDNAKQESTFEYDGDDNLIKSTNPKGGSFTYEYDETIKNRLLSAVTATGLKYAFDYDQFGNAISARISKNDSTDGEYIETNVEYTEDGNYVTKIVDERGNGTSYTYDEETGNVSKITDAKGQETNYTYDALDRIKTMSKTVGTKTYENIYTYVKDKISTITHNGFDYQFLYDDFGNVSQVKVEDQTLVTNEYEANNGNLTSSIYGNNQGISYIYDRFNRIIQKIGTDGSHEYSYDANSNLKEYKDNVNNETTTYLYDLADRVREMINTNGFEIAFEYDENNNINEKEYTFSDFVHQILFTFDKDNRITNVQLDENTNIKTNYDELSRVESKELKQGNTTYETEYTYENTDIENKTTSILKSIKNGENDEISYTYDALGNIETIKEGDTLKAKYYYDELNQLIREDNVDLNKTIVYAYDLGGNMTTKTEYPYTTTSELGEAVNSISYAYENEDWKDQLTKFNGKEITYDNIGNPVEYDGKTFIWENGRQLASIANDQMIIDLGENFHAEKIIETLSGDFNGDNKEDIAAIYNCGNGQIKLLVWLKTEIGLSDGQVWYNSGINGIEISKIENRIVAGDFNGDGKDDIAAVYDYGAETAGILVWKSLGDGFDEMATKYKSLVGDVDANRLTGRTVAGDFNNDGKDDIAGLYDYGGATTGVIVWTSTETGFNKESIWDSSGTGNFNANNTTGRVVAGDFDGDGKTDIAAVYGYPNEAAGIFVWKNTGTGISSGTAWIRTAAGAVNADCMTDRVLVGDFNADGKDDILTIYKYPAGNSRIICCISQPPTFTHFELKYNIGFQFSISELTNKLVIGDYDDDGKADIGLIANSGTKGIIYTFYSTGTEYESPEVLWQTEDMISYQYNDGGIRTSKTVDGVETKYYLDGSNVIYEKTGEDITYYSYDENGLIIGMNRNGTQYYYIKNAQNDIIGILDNTLQQIVSYTYTSWGEIISVKDANGNEITDTNHIGFINPYLYRSYRYDRETGFYYLQSRYYNPEWGRFLNADNFISTGQGLLSHNMYIYCLNSPINMIDANGEFAFVIPALPTLKTLGGIIIAGAKAVAGLGATVGGIYASAKIQDSLQEKVKERTRINVIPKKRNNEDLVIYRWNGTNPGNLVPTEADLNTNTSLSFSTIPKPNSAMTTIKAVNSTGVLYAVQDGVNHVTIYPIGGTVKEWHDAGPNSVWTKALESVVVKYK